MFKLIFLILILSYILYKVAPKKEYSLLNGIIGFSLSLAIIIILFILILNLVYC